MKLLIITQKVDLNDDLLGFFHKWIEEFSKYFEEVNVICLEKGTHNLPANVKIHSIGKERKISRLNILFNFYRLNWKLRKDYDSIFVHMNPEYIAYAGIFWKIMGKKIFFWYAHKLVDLKLKLSEKLADNIFSVSKEGFRLKSDKVKIFGHGIDIDKFVPKANYENNGQFKIIYVGRISEIKNQEMLVGAADLLAKRGLNFLIKLIGRPVSSSDERYLGSLKSSIRNLNLSRYVEFIGSVNYQEINNRYTKSDVNVNLCPTGGLDKAVLESMASGVPVLAVNSGFKKEFGKYEEELLVLENDELDLANKLEALSGQSAEYLKDLGNYLRQRAAENHNLKNLIKNISNVIKE